VPGPSAWPAASAACLLLIAIMGCSSSQQGGRLSGRSRLPLSSLMICMHSCDRCSMAAVAALHAGPA
jgi:hypothetical protein